MARAVWAHAGRLSQKIRSDQEYRSKLGIGPSALPGTLGDACKVWEDRLRKEIAEIGPVTLCYTDGPMFIDPYGPRRKLAMLQQEPYPTNAAALARVKIFGTSRMSMAHS